MPYSVISTPYSVISTITHVKLNTTHFIVRLDSCQPFIDDPPNPRHNRVNLLRQNCVNLPRHNRVNLPRNNRVNLRTSQPRQSSHVTTPSSNLLLTTLIVLSPTLLSTVTTPPFNAVFSLTFNSPTISFSFPRLSASEQELVSSHYGSLLVNCFCAEMSVVTWSVFACCICHFFFTVRRSYTPALRTCKQHHRLPPFNDSFVPLCHLPHHPLFFLLFFLLQFLPHLSFPSHAFFLQLAED